MTLRDRLARKPPGYQFTIGRILAIYSGLMVALLLAALDQTIVATALPKVVSDLGGITQYTWVFTAYMLGSVVTVPLYGKLGDVHGRKFSSSRSSSSSSARRSAAQRRTCGSSSSSAPSRESAPAASSR
jgi:MFS family permease